MVKLVKKEVRQTGFRKLILETVVTRAHSWLLTKAM
jgi:hypothetical protein